MLKMLEVVGSSEAGFSEAVKDAVEQVLGSGEKVHFFEVVEQRGSVRAGKFRRFQVKLKVAVEANKKLDTENFCPTCQQPVMEDGHMCIPATKKDKVCDWCGALIPNERHLCNDKIKELSYICNSCGRAAVKAEYLCSPKKI